MTCKYNIGDMVVAKLIDYTKLGHMFHHKVIGTIVAILDTKSVDVKLKEMEEFETICPEPMHESFRDYAQPKLDRISFYAMDMVNVLFEDIVDHVAKSDIGNLT